MDYARFQDIIKGLGFVFRGHDLNPILPEDWKRILMRCREQRYFDSGKQGLKEALKEQVLRGGGRIVENHRCQQIFVDQKTGFKGVQLQGISNMISASAAIVSVSWDNAQPLFSLPTAQKSAPLGWWFSFQFQIPEEALPPGVTTKMVFADAQAPVVEIEKKEAGFWVARTLLPYQEISLNREYQRKTAQRLFKLMESIFPFIEYAASDLYPDIRDPEQVESYDLVQLYPFRILEQIPTSLLAYGGAGIGHLSPYAGLYIAYEESYPRYGEWGSFHAAATSAIHWAKKNQKILSDDLRKALMT